VELYLYSTIYVHSVDKFLFNPLNVELNPICHFLALLAHHILHVGRIRVKEVPFLHPTPAVGSASLPSCDVQSSRSTTAADVLLDVVCELHTHVKMSCVLLDVVTSRRTLICVGSNLVEVCLEVNVTCGKPTSGRGATCLGRLGGRETFPSTACMYLSRLGGCSFLRRWCCFVSEEKI
jgi:hypothetical protein